MSDTAAQDAILNKHEEVLHLGAGGNTTGDFVWFTRAKEDEADCPMLIRVDKMDWLDMKRPDVITVAVHPGDHLNGEADASH